MRLSVKGKAAIASFVLVIAGIVGTATNTFIVPAELFAFSMLLSFGAIVVIAALMDREEVFTGWLTGIVLAGGMVAIIVGGISIIEMLLER